MKKGKQENNPSAQMDKSYSLDQAIDRFKNSLKDLLEKNKSGDGFSSRLIGVMDTIELPDKPGKRYRPTVILENGIPDQIVIDDYSEGSRVNLVWDELSIADKEALITAIEKKGILK